jgi:hypothetical protein
MKRTTGVEGSFDKERKKENGIKSIYFSFLSVECNSFAGVGGPSV